MVIGATGCLPALCTAEDCASHLGGSAFIAEGVVYYSLNSARKVLVPVHYDGSYQFYKATAHIDCFLALEWWTWPYGFLGFLPLIPSFNGAIFGCLRDFINTVEEKVENDNVVYFMSSKHAMAMQELESTLIHIVSLLWKKYLLAPALSPPVPSFYGLNRTFRSARSARLSITGCRDWFVMWMGLLSFIIAEIDYRSLKHDIPDWFTFLVDQGVSQPWLNSLRQSSVCNFSANCPRAGLFINWLAKDTPSFPLNLFQMANVPVWYAWTPLLAKLVADTPSLADLVPKAEILQNTTAAITHLPSTSYERYGVPHLATTPPQLSNSSHKNASPTSVHSESDMITNARDMTYTQLTLARNTIIKTMPWSSFFCAREIRNLDKARVETPEQKERRLNRERQPSRKKAVVYVWDWSDEDPLQLIRSRVTTQRESIDLLKRFSNSQSIYDSWANEWDLCDYFGDSDEFNDSNDNNDDDYYAESNPQDNAQGHAAYLQARIDGCKSFPVYMPLYQPDEPDRAPLDVSFDISEHLSLFYGFVPPLGYHPKSKAVDKEGWEISLKSIGFMAGTRLLSLHILHEPIIGFIKALQTKAGPSSQSFDVAPNNRLSINTLELFRQIQLVQGLFVVHPSAFRTDRMPWSVALTNVPDAFKGMYFVFSKSSITRLFLYPIDF